MSDGARRVAARLHGFAGAAVVGVERHPHAAAEDVGQPTRHLAVDGMVDARRAGEVLRQMQTDLDGLRIGDAALAADFVRARRTALAAALADPIRSSTAADRLLRRPARPARCHVAAIVPG